MKNFQLYHASPTMGVSIALFCILATSCIFGETTLPKASGIDDEDLPITRQAIASTLNAKYDNPLTAYQTIRHAARQHEATAAYDDLVSLKSKHPGDASLIAETYLAMDAARGYTKFNRFTSERNFTYAEVVQSDADIAAMIHQNPTYWIGYAARAEREIHTPNQLDTSVADLKTWVRLAPSISYAHYELAFALAIPHQKFSSDERARNEAVEALHLGPPESGAALLLFEIDAFPLSPAHPNPFAKADKAIFLSMLPKGTKLRPDIQQMLAARGN